MPTVLPAHTGLRAVAALLVVAFHFSAAGLVGLPLLQGVFSNGYLGVDLFFVLSGFIIHHVYRSKFTTGSIGAQFTSFLRNRLARIYPVHLAILLVLVALHVVTFRSAAPADPEYSPIGVASALFLVHGWFQIPVPNGVSWSVSAEWAAYLVYPLSMIVLRGVPAWFKAALLIVLLVILEAFWQSNPLPRVLPEFALGVAAREVGLQLYTAQWRFRLAGPVVMLLILLTLGFFQPGCIALLCGLFAMLMVVLTDPRDFLSRLLSTPALIYLGEISYSLYMVHSLVRDVLRRGAAHFGFSLLTPLGFAFSVLAAVAAAALIYHAVEMPARRFLRGKTAGVPREAALAPLTTATP